MKFVIAHCAWSSERKASLHRMLQLLGEDSSTFMSDRPEHAYTWARRAWDWIAEQSEPVVLLNDDVIMHPDFKAICSAMVEALPGELISLHSNMPGAVDAAKAGHHWVRCYWYTGPAVIVPPDVARSVLNFWDALPWNYATRVNEDVVAILRAWEEQHPMWCAIPAPVLHDTTTSSTLGYDGHDNRTPTVPWHEFTPKGADLTSVDYWKPTGLEPTVDNPWMAVTKWKQFDAPFEKARTSVTCASRGRGSSERVKWLCAESVSPRAPRQRSEARHDRRPVRPGAKHRLPPLDGRHEPTRLRDRQGARAI